jgi:putative Mg2+ transporter-C (MgtC) family protein
MIPDWEMALRLILACLLGGLIGYQREKSERPAGFRTHTLVCVGSCLIMLLSAYAFNDFYSVNKDPARLAAQVISGMGFLGAGTIFRDGVTVQGLTTAACLWVVSAIGLSVGIGFYCTAIATTFIVYFVLMGIVEHKLFGDKAVVKHNPQRRKGEENYEGKD